VINRERSWTREAGAPPASSATRSVRLAVGDEPVSLRPDELDRLQQALAALASRDAATVADDIAALRLAGGPIRLLPSEAELAAVHLALTAAGRSKPLGPELARLRFLCARPRGSRRQGPV
jgi:hypothetical protein